MKELRGGTERVLDYRIAGEKNWEGTYRGILGFGNSGRDLV